jgi:hypothetical protein
MEIAMSLKLPAAVMVALAGFASPTFALDNGARSSTDDIRAACDNTHRACLVACYLNEGTKFSDDMWRVGCELGCESAYQACIKSIPILTGKLSQSRMRGGLLAN